MLHTGNGARGSIPALVMRTGLIRPVSPQDARRDLDTGHVLHMTVPPSVAMPTAYVDNPPPPPPNVAQTVTATPPTPIQTPAAPGTLPHLPSDRHAWHLHQRRVHPMAQDIRRLHPGAPTLHGTDDELGEWNGRPLARFAIAANPPTEGVQSAAGALRRAAHTLRATGLAHLPPEMIGGPLSALMRGGAVELHFQNGAVVRTAL